MSGRKFEEIVISYTPPELCTYPEYRGKPYYSIKYEENGEHFIGFGTYKIEVLSEYLMEYFIQGQELGCEICVNRNIKSKEACTSPFGTCEFFNDTPDRSFEIAQKSIELGRSLGRTEERAESKTSQSEWIAVKDKFPDKKGEYLVSLENGRIVVADDISIIDNHDFEPKMIAWQPLPEPYRAEVDT